MDEYRKSVFIVVYSKEGSKIKYLVLNRKLHWKGWEFPKGGVENNETEGDAVRRETKEETGLNIKGEIKRFDIHGEYKYQKKYPDRKGLIGQSYSLYAVEVPNGKVKLDEHEHSAFEWLKFEDAVKKVTWEDQKKCLKIVNAFIECKNFRKLITKSGKLIVAGKDEDSNEEIIKQAAPNEEVFHTAAAGSPFANIKGEANKEDIKEAAIFCAKYSRDWKKNKRDIEVHEFKGRDIFKSKGMKAGTFGVKKFQSIKVKKQDIEKFAP